MPQNYSRTEVWEPPSITSLLGPGSCRRRVKSEGQLLGQGLWCSSWPPLQLGAHTDFHQASLATSAPSTQQG